MPVRMELARILIREDSHLHIVELREKDGERVMPIVIGLTEAAAIERRVMGQEPVRPQTHELLDSVIKHLGARVERIIINDLQHDDAGRGTFYARLILRQDDKEIEIDSRPSDAIALGCISEVPIFVEEEVLDAVAADNEAAREGDEAEEVEDDEDDEEAEP